MKQYIKTGDSTYLFEGSHIPGDPGNRHYKIMMKEVEAGEAEIIDYVSDE